MKNLLLVLSIAILLTGCGFLKKKPEAPEVKVPEGFILIRKVNVDPKLLTECPEELPTLEGNLWEDVLVAWSKSNVVFKDCRNNNSGVIDLIRKAFNITDPVKEVKGTTQEKEASK